MLKRGWHREMAFRPCKTEGFYLFIDSMERMDAPMKMVQIPKGTRDVIPCQSFGWQYIEGKMRDACALAGFQEVRTPVFEHTELFLRSVGDTTDVVQKEMYTFEDKGGRSVTLKPEGTAGVVRMFIEQRLYTESLPLKMYYLTCPNFRYEKPQSGRLREFHQFGMECFGTQAPTADAELILSVSGLLQAFGLKNFALSINSIGCPTCRPKYQEALQAFLGERLDKLCPTCNERYTRNPMRILDCKNPSCQAAIQGAPTMLEYLCEECSDHFDSLKRLLDESGQSYHVDAGIVRGLDYYTKTVFEFISQGPDGPITISGGGRYDGLVEELGGPSIPGVGFGMGMERLLMMLELEGLLPPTPPPVSAFLVTMGDEHRDTAFRLLLKLRTAGIATDIDHNARSLKAQMKYAGKLGVPIVVVLGGDELARGAAQVRDMRAGSQQEVPMEDLESVINKILQEGK